MASLTLGGIWPIFNRLIQSSESSDIDRKISALNLAQPYLIQRFSQIGKRVDPFLTDPINLANTVALNYIAAPDNFLSLHQAWRRSGTQYIPFDKHAYLTYDTFISRTGQTFFDSNINAKPIIIAVKEPNIYFDQYFRNTFTDNETITGTTSGATGTVSSVSDTTMTYVVVTGTFTNGEVITGSTSGTTATVASVTSTTMEITITGGTKEIKIAYMKYPDAMEYYDTLTISSVVGTFTVGEVLEGGTSNDTAIVRSVAATELTITGKTGNFSTTETLTGASSSATATMNGAITLLPQTLDWTTKYEQVLCETGKLQWLNMKGSNNVAGTSEIVDAMIKMISFTNRGNEEATWSTDN